MGYSKMNDLVILQTSQGLLQYLIDYHTAKDNNHSERSLQDLKEKVIYDLARTNILYIIGNCDWL